MSKQTTSHIMMVRPANFGFNEQTAESNAFQSNDKSLSQSEISQKAVQEFDSMVEKLRSNGINIHVVQDTETPVKPDAIFPNNWVSYHDDGVVVTYPMYTPNRQAEIREDVLEDMQRSFQIKKRVRFNEFAKDGSILEGTGSMILDREHKIVYACTSPRTEEGLLKSFANWANYEPVIFVSVDEQGQEIYHTNVMMAVGETFVVICMDSVKGEEAKAALKAKFAATNKEVVDISYAQMNQFAGNMLQVRNDDGKTFLVMSNQAFKSLTNEQIMQIEKHTTILDVNIETIETYGGGSARCMMAEVFLSVKD